MILFFKESDKSKINSQNQTLNHASSSYPYQTNSPSLKNQMIDSPYSIYMSDNASMNNPYQTDNSYNIPRGDFQHPTANQLMNTLNTDPRQNNQFVNQNYNQTTATNAINMQNQGQAPVKMQNIPSNPVQNQPQSPSSNRVPGQNSYNQMQHPNQGQNMYTPNMQPQYNQQMQMQM